MYVYLYIVYSLYINIHISTYMHTYRGVVLLGFGQAFVRVYSNCRKTKDMHANLLQKPFSYPSPLFTAGIAADPTGHCADTAKTVSAQAS